MLYRLSQRQLPALIAIVAILMLFIAPEISKTLAQHHVSETGNIISQGKSGHSSITDAGPLDIPEHTMPGMHSEHGRPSAEAHTLDHPHAMQHSTIGMMDDFACGYCQLLVHFPLLVWIFVPVIWLMLIASRIPAVSVPPSFSPVLFPGLPQPRAPPARKVIF